MEDIPAKIKKLEEKMLQTDFWSRKEDAQAAVRELNRLKEEQKAEGKYDAGDAVISVISGAGGDDAEDWARILFDMYAKCAERKAWGVAIIHKHENEHNGIKNITFEVRGRNAYGALKRESGVHRLVRISPFSARKLRHTSFVLVEVIPRFVKPGEIEIKSEDVTIEYSRSSGPGGQNVNKRDTAVRLIHKPTGLTVHVSTERSQLQNREQAMELLKAKIYARKARELEEEKSKMEVDKSVEVEWGHQIRSYVLHPYKMVKDHRTGAETSDAQSVLDGNLDLFIEANKSRGGPLWG